MHRTFLVATAQGAAREPKMYHVGVCQSCTHQLVKQIRLLFFS